MSVFEILMLICFGAAWPFSIRKSWVSRSTHGKSVFFLFVVLVGYAMGVLNKLLVRFDGVVWLYAFNAVMVGADVVLWFRNRAIERSAS